MNTEHSDMRADGDDAAAHADTGNVTVPAGQDAALDAAADIAVDHGSDTDSGADSWVALPGRRIARAQRVRLALPAIVLLVVAAFNGTTVRLALGIPVVVLYCVAFVVAGRSARTWRYLERADDLLIEHGVLFQKKLAVPYGRMQYIDVAVGPVERFLGLATIELHTASSETRARIPGLSPDDAQALRDRLARRGQARMTAL